MEKLYEIMEEFLDVEYNQKSLLFTVQVLEAAFYLDEESETRFVVNAIKCYLEAIEKQMRAAINKLDDYTIWGEHQEE